MSKRTVIEAHGGGQPSVSRDPQARLEAGVELGFSLSADRYRR